MTRNESLLHYLTPTKIAVGNIGTGKEAERLESPETVELSGILTVTKLCESHDFSRYFTVECGNNTVTVRLLLPAWQLFLCPNLGHLVDSIVGKPESMVSSTTGA